MASRTSLLTPKQKEELHKSILEYLSSSGFSSSATEFQKEAAIEPDASSSNSGALEKKWTSVLRLQKKTMELEARVIQLTAELAEFTTGKASGKAPKQMIDMLPVAPARFELSGHRAPVTSVAFHPSVSLFVSTSEDAQIKIWDADSGELEKTLKGHTNAVNCAAFDKTGKILATCSADLSVKLWDFAGSKDCTKTLHGHEHNVSSVVFSPSGDHIISASRDKTIKMWDVQTGYCVRTFEGHDDWVRCVAISEDGTLIATASNDQTVRIWNAATGACIHILRDHTHVVECVAFSPASVNQYLRDAISGSSDGVSSSSSSESSSSSSSPSVDGAIASKKAEKLREKELEDKPGLYLITGSRDKNVIVWETATGRPLATMAGHDNWVRSVVFHPSGKYALSSSDDRSIRVWELSSKRCVKKLMDAHGHFVTSLAFQGNAATRPILVSGGVDHLVKVFDCR